jgi:hypothetical protein
MKLYYFINAIEYDNEMYNGVLDVFNLIIHRIIIDMDNFRLDIFQSITFFKCYNNWCTF